MLKHFGLGIELVMKAKARRSLRSQFCHLAFVLVVRSFNSIRVSHKYKVTQVRIIRGLRSYAYMV